MFQKILSFFGVSPSPSRRDFFKGIGALTLALLPAPAVARVRSVIFPAIHRVFPELIPIESVKIQPMKVPTSLIFYMDYKYDHKTDRTSS